MKGNRFALSISSWFCVPEQGMKEFEMLCRASALFLKAPYMVRPYESFTARPEVAGQSFCITPKKHPIGLIS